MVRNRLIGSAKMERAEEIRKMPGHLLNALSTFKLRPVFS